MGKNAAHKAAQAARGAGTEDAAPTADTGDGVDASFHTAEWHAARLTQLTGPRRETLEEFKRRVAGEEAALHAAASAQDAAEQEYRLAMEEERNRRLGLTAAGQSGKDRKKDRKSKKEKKDKSHKKSRKEDKDKRKRKSRGHERSEKKRRRHSSSSESNSYGSGHDSDGSASRKRRRSASPRRP